jgi:hypothetical protein
MAVSRHVEEKTDKSIIRWVLLLHFMRYIALQNIWHGFHCTALLVPTEFTTC